MSKYKFYKNSKTRFHPSLEVSSNEFEWQNMELTSSPTKDGRYIELKENPNENWKTKSYLRKYIRKDPICTRKQLLRKYKLSEEDIKEIEKYILNNKKS